MHHVHISTEFMLVITLFVLGLVGILAAFLVSIRRDKLAARRLEEECRRNPGISTTSGPWSKTDPYPTRRFDSVSPPASEYPSRGIAPPSAAAPMYAGPAVVHTGNSGGDLLTGMLVGNMLANSGHHHDTTVVHETYSSPAPAPSYSSSSDSGSSSGYDYSSSSSSYDSSSSSYDSGSSGGFDASF